MKKIIVTKWDDWFKISEVGHFGVAKMGVPTSSGGYRAMDIIFEKAEAHQECQIEQLHGC